MHFASFKYNENPYFDNKKGNGVPDDSEFIKFASLIANSKTARHHNPSSWTSAQKSRPRTGTSVHEMRANFADPEACLKHVFRVRFGQYAPCPDCQKQVKWYRIRGTRRFGTNCCKRKQISPLADTLFSFSAIPLEKWFYALLHFCNASIGTGPMFLADHLGISRKAAIRMSGRIRAHLSAIDSVRTIGGPGQTVYVDETKLKNIHDGSARSDKHLKILSVCDDHEFLIIPILKGRLTYSSTLFNGRIQAGSVIKVRAPEVLRRIRGYRPHESVRGYMTELAPDPFHPLFGQMSVMIIAMKQFLMRNHIWLSKSHIENYIGHFSFVYRRRHAGRDIYRDAVSMFPIIAKQTLVGA